MSPSDPIIVSPSRKPADRSATRAVYIVVAEDLTTECGYQEYRANVLEKFEHHVEVKGPKLSTAQAEKLRKNPNTKSAGTVCDTEIPISRIIRIENLSYQQRKA
jgi:hypothetical protein